MRNSLAIAQDDDFSLDATASNKLRAFLGSSNFNRPQCHFYLRCAHKKVVN